jgi:hypothetical protein
MTVIFAAKHKFGEYYARYELHLPPSAYCVTTRAERMYGLRPGAEVYLVVAPRYRMTLTEQREYDMARLVLNAGKVNYKLVYLP